MATRHVRTATHRRTHTRGAWQPPHPAQTQSSCAWQRSAAMCWSSSVVRNRQDFKTCRISPRLNLAFCSPSKLDDTIHCSQTVGFVSMSYEAGRNLACLEILTKDRSSLSSPAFRCSLLRRLGAAPAATPPAYPLPSSSSPPFLQPVCRSLCTHSTLHLGHACSYTH